jgi:ABC-2 type transport system ATP-binding protein
MVVADGPFKSIAKEADTNLQQLFNDLTGFAEHGQKAQSFVDIVTGGESHETI